MVVFIYTDASFPLDENNIFLSCPYKNEKQFRKENKEDNFKVIASYDMVELLKLSKS